MKHARTIRLILALAGIALLLVGLIAPMFLFETASEPSMGIIGGADFPTYLFLLQAAAGGLFLWMAVAGAVMICASFVLLLVRIGKKN